MRLVADRNGKSIEMALFQTLQLSERRLGAWLHDTRPALENVPCTDDAWAGFADNAADAGLAALVLDHASVNGVELPSICRERLRAAAMTVAVRHLNMMRELERIVQAFNHAGVPVMLLKGAALNLTVYERADQRPMSDLDLLVKPEHVREALALLRENGCTAGYDLIRDDFFPRYHYEVELFSGGPRPVRLDLHARPFRPLRLAGIIADDALWHGAGAMRLGKAEAFIPRAELMFLQLAGHAGFHGCSRLIWLYDLKRLVKHYGSSLDWSLILQFAQRWRLSRAVLYAIVQTEELLGPAFPPAARADLRTHPANWQDRWTLRQAPKDAASPLVHLTCNLLCTPGVRFRLGYLMAHLFPGPKHLGENYPYRHYGWISCARVLRAFRGLSKVLALPLYGIAAVFETVIQRCGQFRCAPTGQCELNLEP